MPYAQDSALASAAGALGGYYDAKNKKRQQDIENQQKAQEDADSQANAMATLGLQRTNDQATQDYRTATAASRQRQLDIDAANSGRADAVQATKDAAAKKVSDFQAGGLHYPKNWTTMKPEQKIGYLQVRLNNAQKAGDTKTVTDTEGEINKVATQAAADRKAEAAAKEQAKKDAAGPKPTYADLHPRPTGGRTPTPQELYFEQHGYMPPSYSEAHPKPDKTKATSVPQQRSADADDAGKAIAAGGDRDKIVKHYAAKWNITTDKASDELPDSP